MMIWHITSTCWIFGVICYELHFMLCSSFRCLRYLPPTRSRAARNALLVYLWAAAIATWSSFGNSSFPVEPTMQNDVFCIPINHDRKTLLFLWLFLIPISCLAPYSYVGWLVWEARRSKLLPKKGQRRSISVFFFRIALCYAIIMAPSILAVFFRNTWVTWSAIILGYSQVFVTAILSLQKPDIQLAVREMLSRLCCSSIPIKSGKRSSSEGNDTLSQCNRTGSRLSIFSSSLTVSSQMNLPGGSKGSARASITPFSFRISEELYEEQSDLDNLNPLPHTTHAATPEEDVYEDVPRQSELHYQFDDELEPDNPDDVICFHIEEEEDESNLPVCPFDP